MRIGIVLFTKVPVRGRIKTRLYISNGGILTEEEAEELYTACLLDVCEACIVASAAEQEVDLWVCHDQEGDRQKIQELLQKTSDPGRFRGVFADQGGSFDDRMQYAAEWVLRGQGGEPADEGVIIIGGDLPSLQPSTLRFAVERLRMLSRTKEGRAAAAAAPGAGAKNGDLGAALTVGPCQEGGFSIVGLTKATPFDFYGVFYNAQGRTALDMVVDKATAASIPLALLDTVPDVDIPTDLASIIPVLRALEVAAVTDPQIVVPRHTLAVIRRLGFESVALSGEETVGTAS
ncbi:MAG: TIGR04282 family arsenosugar biosynthesis glycosyltransferase [Moorellaceae bacterium]